MFQYHEEEIYIHIKLKYENLWESLAIFSNQDYDLM